MRFVDPIPALELRKADYGIMDTFYRSVAQGALSVGKGLVGTAEFGLELLPWVDDIESMEKWRFNIKKAEERFAVDPDSPWEWGASVLGQALPYVGAALTAGYVGGPLMAGGIGFAVEGQEAYEGAIARGQSEGKANTERAIVGTINAVIETMQISRLMKFSGKGTKSLKFLKENIRKKAWDKVRATAGEFGADILWNSVNEGLQEALQEGVQIVVPYALEGKESLPLNQDGSINVMALAERVGSAALAGAVVSPFLGGARAFAQVVADPKVNQMLQHRDELIEQAKTKEDKAIVRREFNRLIENTTGLSIDEVENKSPRKDIQPTPSGIEVYRSGDIKEDIPLLHFGTEAASKKAAAGRKDVALKHGFLDINNPAKMIDSGRSHNKLPVALVEDIVAGNNEGIDSSLVAVIRQIEKTQGTKAAFQAISQALENHGYDGIVYENVNEDPGSLSYVVLRSTQFKSADVAIKADKDYSTRLDRLESAAEQIAEMRPFSEKTISENTAKAFSEMRNMWNELDKTFPEMSEFEKAVRAQAQLKGKRSPGFSLTDLTLTEQDMEAFLKAVPANIDNDFQVAMARSALLKFISGESLPERSEIKALEPIFGRTIVKKMNESLAIVKRKGLKKGQRIWRSLVDALNLPRALLASMDVSAAGRQGFFMLFTDPKAWVKGLSSGYKAFFSPEYADYIDLVLRTRPFYRKMMKDGIFMSEIGGLNSSEEFFASSFAHKIPGIKASERAYVTTLNVMRAYTYAHIAEQWEGAGKSEADYKHMAKIINHLTGRGDLKWLKDHANTLNIAFFAPKLTVARLQTPTDLIPTGQSLKDVVSDFEKWQKGEIKFRQVGGPRRILAGTLVKAFGVGTMLMFLLSQLKGVKVEKDPRSSDFGKIKIGDTRFDIWAGNSQIMRLVAGLASSQRKTIGTGDIIPADRSEIMWRFLQTKFSPVMGAIVDAHRGENFRGEVIEPTLESGKREVWERFAPLAIQDTVDAINYQGYNATSLFASVSAAHGIGVMTYPESEGARTAKVKDQYAMEFFGERWNDVGPKAQQLLRLHYPIITQQELVADQARLDRKSSARFMNEIKASERQLRRSFKPDVREELDRLLVDVGGLSRKIGTDWYLSNERYLWYKKTVADRLNDLLPKYLTLDIEPVIKRQFIDKIISDVKKSVRMELINQANIKDFSSDFPGKR